MHRKLLPFLYARSARRAAGSGLSFRYTRSARRAAGSGLLALLALVVLTVAIAACSPAELDVSLANPTLQPSPSPTEFAGIPLYGTGSDGTLVVAAGTSATVNICHQLADLNNSTSLDLSSTAGFEPGQVLLLLQERDRTSVTPPGRAGTFELVRLAKLMNPATAFTTAPVTNDYDSALGARAQACSVPEYLTLTVEGDATLRAAPRDLVAGGVLAFLVSSSLDIGPGAILTANGLGFAGGACDSNSETMTSDAPDDVQGGGKGEGLLAAGEGRGHLANGGGGGNPFQAGGGGGGGARGGGRGGGSVVDESRAFGEGSEGIAVIPGLGRLLFGGGGGGGHSASGEAPPCDGGNGGGVVFIQARSAYGADGQVGAAGRDIDEPGLVTSGGGGGGGGGGTIWLIVETGEDFHPERISVTGARGGNTGVSVPAGAGPGGGGGGGFARIGGFTDYELFLQGGTHGVVEGTDEARGATSGSSGTIF